MGLEFKLTDRELPISPVFIRFLAQVLSGRPFDREDWAEQRSEALSPNESDPHSASDAATIVMGSKMGRERLTQAYTLLFALLTGDLAPLHDLQSRYHFVNFVGIPRTGGSYLTAELFRALGMQPERVASGLAHDSFPDAGPFQLENGINSWVMSLKTMAEYLTMVETCFGDRKPHSGKIVVPKKLTKSAYLGAFFHRVLGEESEYILTVSTLPQVAYPPMRNPAACRPTAVSPCARTSRSGAAGTCGISAATRNCSGTWTTSTRTFATGNSINARLP